MASKKVIIGYVNLLRGTEMTNTQFGYAASYERLYVDKGRYPIFTYENDLEKDKDGKIKLGWRNYIGYEGTVIEGNVGGKAGEKTSYHVMVYDYSLAGDFLNMRTYKRGTQMDFVLAPEWGIEIYDFVSSIDNRRIFTKGITLKDGFNINYLE